ncbi:Pentatricopeptide repeat-containing protein [Quillaja saponaria]|uniref:Pentatricopeptide repeat-containing protein n=1 Tax=Quillaja saponaria TaxID=32244 RepID=A0AAD7LI76_QUISA|nr:Pentatricopeptide repeat-containing protein [Quillaja saponaria]
MHQIDGFVLSTVIGVFAEFALVEQGKQMHAYTIKVSSGLDKSVANSILDAHLKRGLTDEAEILVKTMPTKNVVSWTVMITGYERGKCSHSELIEESQEYFSRFDWSQQSIPEVEHYGCMVDLLGRAGHLKEANDLLEKIPLKSNVGIWQTLLSASRMHGNPEMGREVGRILLILDGDNRSWA